MPTVIVEGCTESQRDSWVRGMIERGIHARPFFYPLSSMPMFEEAPENDVAHSIFGRGINLPSSYELTEDEVSHICDVLIDMINQSGE